MVRPQKFKLHVMTPVHIGCGDEYEPTSFKIDTDRKKLIEFDQFKFVKSLPDNDKTEFFNICKKGTIGSIIEIYNFISKQKVEGREVDIPDEFIEHFRKVKSLSIKDERKVQQELNKFSISKTAYNMNADTPYIPGSSIKGAIRTAYLSVAAKREEITDWNPKNVKKLEEKLLGGGFDKDPFTKFKVSDFVPVENVRTKIVYAVNKKKIPNKREARGPYQILETIVEDSVFEGSIIPDKLNKKDNNITPNEIIKASNKFYKKIAEEENSIMQRIGFPSTLITRLNQNFKNKKWILLRIGRHCGAEAITMEGLRKIKVRMGRRETRILPHATTIWLASEKRLPKNGDRLKPFGWVVLVKDNS